MRKHPIISSIAAFIVLAGIVGSAAGGASHSGATASPALVTASTQQAAAVTTATKPQAPAAPQTFTGNGSENLGTINVPTDSTLTWSEPGGNQTGFAVSSDLTDNANMISFDQHGLSGKDAVSAGTYHNVSVDADGNFTITITPGS
jgi:hypothetical protein